MLRPKPRIHSVDETWTENVGGEACSDHVFVRTAAKDITFKNVDFRYSTFDACYLRGCTFDSCDFTGCRFVGTNCHGSTFTGCKFDYARFDKTEITAAILDECCPPFENLKARFARTLRMNFHSLGDPDGVGRAMAVELAATEVHLLKMWKSNEAYYRKKVRGWNRFFAFTRWLYFKLLDQMWGNGVSVFTSNGPPIFMRIPPWFRASRDF